MIRVDVTKEDLRLGDHSSWGCPIALAIRRASGCLGVNVASGDRHMARVSVEGGITVYRLADKAVDFLEEWDNWREVAPFSFELQPWAR